MTTSITKNKENKVIKKQGRPNKKNPATIKKISSMLKQGNSIADACRVSGISQPTFFAWVKTGEGLARVFESAKAEYFTTLRRSVHRDAVKDGSLAHKVLQSEGQYEKDQSNKPIIINIGAETITISNGQDLNQQ